MPASEGRALAMGADGTDGATVQGIALAGTTWRTPWGPGSNLQGLDEHPVVHEGLDEHPVVHVSAYDAEAYCA